MIHRLADKIVEGKRKKLLKLNEDLNISSEDIRKVSLASLIVAENSSKYWDLTLSEAAGQLDTWAQILAYFSVSSIVL